MKNKKGSFLISLILAGLFALFLLVSCSEAEQLALATQAADFGKTVVAGAPTIAQQMQTEGAKAAATARRIAPTVIDTAKTQAAKAGTNVARLAPTVQEVAPTVAEVAQTQGARVLQTAQELAPTVFEAAQTIVPPLVDAAKSRIGTQVAEWLATPSPAGGALSSAVAVYIVVQGDILDDVAQRMGSSPEALIQLNQERYPSLAKWPPTLQPGWILIIARQTAAAPISLSTPTPGGVTTGTTPGCDTSSFTFLTQPIQCTQAFLDYVSSTGPALKCVSLQNPLASSSTHTVVVGWYLTDATDQLAYGWFYDAVKQDVLVGPAVVITSSTYLECTP